MPTLKLQFKDTIIGEYPLEPGSSLTIGRRESNNVVIDNMAVSGTHAKVDVLEDGYLITDLKSKNGTFVNDKLISSHWLEKDDVVTIGKHKLLFTLAQGEAAPQSHEANSDKTMVLDTEEYRKMLDRTAPNITAKPQGQKEPMATLSFLAGGEGEFDISKKLTKIGKDPASDIVVGGFMMGKTAATISKRPTGYYLNYVEGMAKPKVNGKAIKDSVQLKEFDSIEIGSARMEFIMKE